MSEYPVIVHKEIIEQEPDTDGWRRFTAGPRVAVSPTVYDARDESWWGLSDGEREAFTDWAREQGIPYDGRSVYRVEIHGIEQHVARVFEYDLDEQGRKRIAPATDDVAVKAPRDWPIAMLPPVHPRACTPRAS